VGTLATDGRRLVSTFHGFSFLAGAGPVPPGRESQTLKNLLKNRVLDPPYRGAVKRRIGARMATVLFVPVDNLGEGE
jgi:hypothetical protein